MEYDASRPFNTPIESGLRSLAILNAVQPQYYDLQRLVYYDYLLVHSGDINGGPVSLHPAVPHRSGQLLVRRDLIEKGLDLMFARELIDKRYSKSGVTYGATKLTNLFLNLLETPYAKQIRLNAAWVAKEFKDYNDKKLSRFMDAQLGRWGAEFKQDALLRDF